MSDWIDVSVPIRHGMPHWPNNPPIEVERIKDMASGGSSNVSRLSCGVHTATHVDAPLHFDSSAPGVDRLPLEALIGPARVIGIEDPVHVTVAALEAAAVAEGERVLFRTRNSPRVLQSETFVEDAVHISLEAAEWLAQRRVKTIGVDYLSVGGYRAKNGAAVHHALIGAGIVLIEGLDLTHAMPGSYELVCLPLKIADCDGAPARVVLKRA